MLAISAPLQEGQVILERRGRGGGLGDESSFSDANRKYEEIAMSHGGSFFLSGWFVEEFERWKLVDGELHRAVVPVRGMKVSVKEAVFSVLLSSPL